MKILQLFPAPSYLRVVYSVDPNEEGESLFMGPAVFAAVVEDEEGNRTVRVLTLPDTEFSDRLEFASELNNFLGLGIVRYNANTEEERLDNAETWQELSHEFRAKIVKQAQ